MAHFINAKGARISNSIQQAGLKAKMTIGVWGAAGLSVGPNDRSIATIKNLGPDNNNNTWFELTAEKTGYVMVEAKQGASVWDYFQLAVVQAAAAAPVTPSAPPARALKPAEILLNLHDFSPDMKAVLGSLNGMSMSEMLSTISQVNAVGLLFKLTTNFDVNAAAFNKTRLNVAIKAVEMRGRIHPLDFEQQFSAALVTLPQDQRRQIRMKLALRDNPPRKAIIVSSSGQRFVMNRLENRKQTFFRLHNDDSFSTKTCTIGYGTKVHDGPCDGRASEARFKNGITDGEARELAVKDLNTFAATLNAVCKVELRQHQADALISFMYNAGGLHELTKPVNEARYEEIPALIRKTRIKNGELTPRRNLEADLFASGKY